MLKLKPLVVGAILSDGQRVEIPPQNEVDAIAYVESLYNGKVVSWLYGV